MSKPDQSPQKAPEETEGAPEYQVPSFEELMLLVFSGPMCFECLEEAEDKSEDEIKESRANE